MSEVSLEKLTDQPSVNYFLLCYFILSGIKLFITQPTMVFLCCFHGYTIQMNCQQQGNFLGPYFTWT